MNASVIDLYTSSWRKVESLEPKASAKLANKRGDSIHFNEKVARAIADLVVMELPKAAPKLATSY